jgi:hypothetical protein
VARRHIDASITGSYDIFDGEDAILGDATATAFEDSVTAVWAAAIEMRGVGQYTTVTTMEIGGHTFYPGTYYAGGGITVDVDSTVTFDAGGDENAQFLIQGQSTMHVYDGAEIILEGGARAENIVWAVRTVFDVQKDAKFKGTIMAGTAVTFGADVVIEGSILAITAITLGANNEVHGCVAALTAITFGTGNSITAEQPEEDLIPAVINNFPALANDDDQVIIACLPLTDTPAGTCDAAAMEEDMLALLNNCTAEGISAAGYRRRARGIATPQVADMVIVPTPTFDQFEGLGRSVRGLRQLMQLQCHTTQPDFLTTCICCSLPDTPSYCGSPMRGRRKLQGVTAADVEAFLPSITDTCTSQYAALAVASPNCYAASGDEGALQCTAMMVTGGPE